MSMRSLRFAIRQLVGCLLMVPAIVTDVAIWLVRVFKGSNTNLARCQWLLMIFFSSLWIAVLCSLMTRTPGISTLVAESIGLRASTSEVDLKEVIQLIENKRKSLGIR